MAGWLEKICHLLREWHQEWRESLRPDPRPSTREGLAKEIHKLMSQITDITDAIQANITQVATQIAALATGIVALDALITAFQNSPGTLSPSDQTALNGVQTASAALVTQVKAISTAPPPTP